MAFSLRARESWFEEAGRATPAQQVQALSFAGVGNARRYTTCAPGASHRGWPDKITGEKDQMEKIYMTIKCGHCSNKAPMEVVAEYNRIEDCEDERGNSPFSLTWEYGPVWRIVRCPACLGVTFLKYIYHSMFDPDEWSMEILHPVNEQKELP
jgi:hypothetical protein